jgi:hypothetical protein
MESYDVIVTGSGASACHTEGVGQGFKRMITERRRKTKAQSAGRSIVRRVAILNEGMSAPRQGLLLRRGDKCPANDIG